MKERVLVIGIGRLGSSLVRNLYDTGAEVIALDTDLENINSVKSKSHLAIQGDGTDIEVLREIGASTVDMAIVSIGEDFEASAMTLTNLIELNVKRVAVRAPTTRLARIYQSIGAHEVFYVEEDMGKILSLRFMRPSIKHEMDLGFGLKMVEWSPGKWTHGKTLAELKLPTKFKIQVVGFRDPVNPKEILMPTPDYVIKGEILALILGHDRDIQKLLEQ
ncbi:MAG: TrkA family potassium uptake protein [Bdellovibrionaceae bacterium]|nr:TrkA family potassium uptake protein [Pseudobdellovibrionaceae bacterium]